MKDDKYNGGKTMNTNELDYFKKLFKVDIIRKLLKLDNELIEGTITRDLKNDYEKTLNFIRYGFEEGIKFERDKIK